MFFWAMWWHWYFWAMWWHWFFNLFSYNFLCKSIWRQNNSIKPARKVRSSLDYWSSLIFSSYPLLQYRQDRTKGTTGQRSRSQVGTNAWHYHFCNMNLACGNCFFYYFFLTFIITFNRLHQSCSFETFCKAFNIFTIMQNSVKELEKKTSIYWLTGDKVEYAGLIVFGISVNGQAGSSLPQCTMQLGESEENCTSKVWSKFTLQTVKFRWKQRKQSTTFEKNKTKFMNLTPPVESDIGFEMVANQSQCERLIWLNVTESSVEDKATSEQQEHACKLRNFCTTRFDLIFFKHLVLR